MKRTLRTDHHPPRVIRKHYQPPELQPEAELDTSIGDPDDLLAIYRERADLADLEVELRPIRWCSLQPD